MTNPKKKQVEVLELWTNLKKKIMTNLQELKAKHKNNWAVVKSKSPSKQVKVLSTRQLEKLKDSLLEKQSLLQNLRDRMNQRSKKELVSPVEQVECERLSKEITSLQSQIAKQEELEKPETRLALFRNYNELKQDLTRTNEKLYELDYKLNWLRTLVRAGDINQLQELVRKAKI